MWILLVSRGTSLIRTKITNIYRQLQRYRWGSSIICMKNARFIFHELLSSRLSDFFFYSFLHCILSAIVEVFISFIDTNSWWIWWSRPSSDSHCSIIRLRSFYYSWKCGKASFLAEKVQFLKLVKLLLKFSISYKCRNFLYLQFCNNFFFRFPQLKDKHFANSRNADFEIHVRRQTKGRGVDIVLNSLAQQMLQACWFQMLKISFTRVDYGSKNHTVEKI